MWDAILFDLDGTFLLFESSEEDFYRAYFYLLGEFCRDVVEPKTLIPTIQKLVREISTYQHSKKSNYERFVNGMQKEYGFQVAKELEERFNEFYSTRFKELKTLTFPNKKLIKWMESFEAKKILATNPIFPKKAIIERMNWAGLKENDFILVTTLENFSVSKPQPEYYIEISHRVKVLPERCLMVGNDPFLDGSCTKAGMTFKHVEEL